MPGNLLVADTISEHMPERSFGRTVRYRRTRLGLSQAELAELVGRSPSTIRAWERDSSQPTDPKVLSALSAILGVDERHLFHKVGQVVPDVETSPTIEEALATISPATEDPQGEPSDTPFATSELVREALTTDEETVDLSAASEQRSETPTPKDDMQLLDSAAATGGVQVAETEPATDQVPPSPEPVGTSTSPPQVIEAYQVPTQQPRREAASYLEQPGQRQLYRLRTLATIVLLFALAVALLWAAGESLGALGDWWDDFFGNLRL